MSALEQESKFFNDNVANWVAEHLGQFVLISGTEVIGFYKTIDEAFAEGGKRFGLGDFFVKQILTAEQVNVSFFGQAY